MIPLSVVIITLNEERNIGRCLTSIEAIADDIVVVDSFSKDNTKKICCFFPKVRFFQKAWEGYSVAKNYGNQLAKYNHILSLDADEALSQELKTHIIAIKNNCKYDAYSFNRLTNYCGKWIYHSGWYPDKKIRLWNAKKAYWKGEIHETLIFQKSFSHKYVPADILHYSYESIEQHVIVAYKYSDITAKELVRAKKKIGFVKLFLSPLWRFISIFLLRKGFKDGFYGLLIAVISSYAGFLKYALVKYYQINKLLKDK